MGFYLRVRAASGSTLSIYLQSLGDVYLDDIKLVSGNAQPVPITGLYGTGVNNAATILPDNSVDPHNKLLLSADPSFPARTRTRSITPTRFPRMGLGSAAGRTPTGLGRVRIRVMAIHPAITRIARRSISRSSIWARCSSTSNGRVTVKGWTFESTASARGSIPPYPPQPSESWHSFVITNGFIPGTNVLDFLINRNGGVYPTGLRAEVIGSGVPTSELGANILVDGDFESAFPGPWTVSSNLSGLAISAAIKHVGNASLHRVSLSAGLSQNTSIYQVILPGLALGQPYTLSFWYRQSTNGGPLIARLSGSGIVVNESPTPPPGLAQATATPGAANNVQASAPHGWSFTIRLPTSSP